MVEDVMRRGFAPWADPGIRPLVRFEAVTKRFGAVAAVDRLSLAIYEREFFALLGPSGCGKTTLSAPAGRLRDARRRPHPARRMTTSAVCRPIGGRST